MPGLDPGIRRRDMDCRVKPGNDKIESGDGAARFR